MRRIFACALLFSCALLLWADLRYVEIGSIGNAPSVRVENIGDLQFLIKHHGIEVGYLLKGKENPSDVRLVVIGDGTYFFFDMNGHLSIEGYLAGERGGFRNGLDFQEAVELGLTQAAKPDSTCYYFYKRNQFKSVEDCTDAFKKGFAFRETQWTARNGREEVKVEGTESSAYYRAVAAQLADYKEYQEFMPGLERGYKTKADILDAKKKGFDAAKGWEYYTAMERGFSKYEDYKLATDLGLESQVDFARYQRIVSEVESIMSRQKLEKREAFIYFYLCQIPKGQQSFEVLTKTLEEMQGEQDATLTKALDLYYSDIPSLEEWNKSRSRSYSTSQYRYQTVSSLLSSSSLASFFKTVDTSGIGRYDEASGIFTRNGSNFIQLVAQARQPSPPNQVPASGGQTEGLPLIPECGIVDWIGGNTSRQAVIPVSQEYGSKREVLDWYTSLGQVSTKTSDAIPASVIVEVVLGYKQADKAASTEITQRQTEIKDYLRRYFSALTAEDLRPRNEEERRIEIKQAINQKILKDSEIRDVRFLSLQIIEQ
ncbi:MAG: flagellar basal body-associated FliL family protein [Treponema sp.]|nr:flagellar basal body-associated FliL family protein [Treponema sp.]